MSHPIPAADRKRLAEAIHNAMSHVRAEEAATARYVRNETPDRDGLDLARREEQTAATEMWSMFYGLLGVDDDDLGRTVTG